MKIVMLDTPDAGKGTQAKKIAIKYQTPHASTGDIFRANIRNDTKLGMKVKPYTNVGGLIPDKTTIGILLDRIHEEDYKNRHVLDGFLGIILRAENFIKVLDDMGEAIDCAINVDAPDENIINRISGRRMCPSYGAIYHIVYNPPKKEGIRDVYGQQLVLRDGDKPETARKRLDAYHDQAQSLIEYCKEADILAEVDDTLDMEEVLQATIGTLGA